jgi:aryl-alcohol dehydrogenase-like predicted oxidoreductase
MMQHHELGMTVWSPLAFSFLTGKLTQSNLRDAGRYSKEMDLLPFDKEHGFQIAEVLRKIGDAHGATVPQVAIAWLLSKKSVSSILIGASKLSQLEDNLGSTSVQLDQSELQMLDDATRLAPAYPNWFFDSMLDKTLAAELSWGA